MEESDKDRARVRRHLSDLYDSAVRNAVEVNRKAVDISMDTAKERAQYFEKLALGCGAAVLGIASFIGSKSGQHPQPVWLFRTALIALALGTCTAMLRNWRFQFYVMAHWKQTNVSAQFDRLKAEDACMREIGGVDASGKIDPVKWQVTYEAGTQELTTRLAIEKKGEMKFRAQVGWLEHVTLLCVALAVCFVVALCWLNL